jgi:hypothetical protein
VCCCECAGEVDFAIVASCECAETSGEWLLRFEIRQICSKVSSCENKLILLLFLMNWIFPCAFL